MAVRRDASPVAGVEVLYRCPGALDARGVHQACGMEAVVTETGEEGWGGVFHCTKMERVGPVEAPAASEVGG